MTVDLVNGESRVFGIMGNPVGHSFSPVLQNTIAKMLGKNIIYVPFKVETGQVKKAVDGAFALGIDGFNVTVPHKKEVVEALCRIDPLAKAIGAVNTLKRTEEGYKGYNTDILGLGKCFETEDAEIEGKTVVVLGAGGAANAAVTLGAVRGAKEIIIVNRTRENAEKLKASVKNNYSCPISIISFDEIMDISSPEIVIQTTSVGMGEGVWKSPVDNTEFFSKVKFMVDIVYTPWETKILKDAREKGVCAVNGFDMLIYQGIASFEIWHDMKVDNDKAKEMRDILANYYRGKGK